MILEKKNIYIYIFFFYYYCIAQTCVKNILSFGSNLSVLINDLKFFRCSFRQLSYFGVAYQSVTMLRIIFILFLSLTIFKICSAPCSLNLKQFLPQHIISIQ